MPVTHQEEPVAAGRDESTADHDSVGLLLVCTGNVCRSAVALHLARRWLGAGIPVSSAGTAAVAGRPVHPFSRSALEALGGQADGFASQRLDAGTAARADLVLTMTADHREDVLRLAPRQLRRVFTLPEAAALCGAVDATALLRLPLPERLGALAGLLGAARASRPRSSRVDDVPDPIGAPAETHHQVARLVATDLRRVTDALLGRPFEPTVLMPGRPPVPAR